MKGILFIGDSFTWGQGLHYYSELNNVEYITQEMPTFSIEHLTKAHIDFKNTLRFPRLVANHFNTFEITRDGNGGDEDILIEYGNWILSEECINGNQRIFKDDISYLIYQTTSPFRNEYSFVLNGETIKISKQTIDEYFTGMMDKQHLVEKILKHISIEYNNDIDAFFDNHIRLNLIRIKELLLKFENVGIKTYILNWLHYYDKFIKDDNWLLEKTINIEYNNETFSCFQDAINKYRELGLSGDTSLPPNQDGHLSKLGNRLIADSIIKKIQNNI
jgi:hypothetical protein